VSFSITTFAALKTAITSLAKRTDLVSKYDDFIGLAEFVMFRDLNLRITEASSTGTTSGATITIPAGLDRIERLSLVSDSKTYTLDYTSPNGVEPLTYGTGLPSRYTVEDGVIKLLTAPGSAYSYTIHYIPSLTPLSDSNTSNWLLANAPDAYLYGSLEQLSHHALDEPRAAKYHGMLLASLDSIQRSDEARRFPISGGLQIKPRNAR
jgi:hypothetical protein